MPKGKKVGITKPTGVYKLVRGWPTSKPRYFKPVEFRPPKRHEFYLSGAIPEVYRAYDNLKDSYWIMREVEMEWCNCCKGTGKVVKGWLDEKPNGQPDADDVDGCVIR